MTETTQEKLRRNTRVMMATWAWGQGMNFVRMMVLIDFLSREAYGLWLFSFAILSYFAMYNFGLANAFVKYAAQYTARNEITALSRLLSTGMAIGWGIALAILAVLFFATDWMVRFFGVADISADAHFVLYGVGIATAFTMAFSVYGAVLTGIHRLDLKNYAHVSVQTIEFTTMVILLNLGFGIRSVTVLYAASLVAITLVSALLVYRQVPGLRLNPLLARRACLREIFSQGGRMQLLGIVAMMVSTLDVVLYTKFGGAAFTGVYGAAQRVAQRAQEAAQQGFGALAPVSAELIATRRYEDLAGVYQASLRITAIGCAWMFAYLAVHSEAVMRFVMDEEYEPLAAFALTVVSTGALLHTLTGPGSSMLRGGGFVLIEIVYLVIAIGTFVGLMYLGGPVDWASGIPGNYPIDPAMAAAWPLSLGGASLVFLLLANRFFRAPLLAPFEACWPTLVAAPLLAWCVSWVWRAAALPLPTGRWEALGYVIPTLGAYTAMFVLAAAFLPGLSRSDKEQIVRFVPGGWRLWRHLERFAG